jgi:Protein of unknown function (DUF975)
MNFDISKAFSNAFENTKKHFWFLTALSVISLILQIPNNLSRFIPEDKPGLFAVLGLFSLLILPIMIYFSTAIVKVYLEITDNKKISFFNLKVKWSLVGKNFLLGLLFSLIFCAITIPFILVAVGAFIFAIAGNSDIAGNLETNIGPALPYLATSFIVILLMFIPLIYLSIRFGFAPYYLIDKDADIIESFNKSSELTKGNKWALLGFSILAGLLALSGFLAFGVGAFFTYPMAMLAEFDIYRQLTKQLDEE